MKKVFDKLRRSLVVRVGLIYAATAWLLGQIIEVITPYLGLADTVAEVAAELAGINFIFSLLISWIVEAASPPDRKFVLIRMAWMLGPMALGINVYLYILISGGFSTRINAYLALGLFLLVTHLWAQMSAPFARAWTFRRAEDPAALIRAEQRFQWPLKPKEVRKTEIHIEPKLYFTFLAGIAAIVFIVSETVLGEFFGDTVESVGYIGASIIALAIAAVMYPTHKRASKYFKLPKDVESDSGADNAKSVVAEIVNSLLSCLRVCFIQYWYLTIPAILLGILIRRFGALVF